MHNTIKRQALSALLKYVQRPEVKGLNNTPGFRSACNRIQVVCTTQVLTQTQKLLTFEGGKSLNGPLNLI